jgi:prevent-host-death family protein
MSTIGAFEAKTHFARLLARVARGEEIVITRHGAPVARLVPAGGVDRGRVRTAIARLKKFSQGQTLGRLSVRALREAGRR